MTSIPADYEERVYAGVLGKIIGVYLGRPFEGWSYERVSCQLGEITDYVHDRLGLPLIVTDDDISGTFTFFRALEDSGYDPAITSEQIGRGWLNYIIEDRTILWWGGVGNSTEHTAFARLKAGIPAPASGSTRLNGAVIAEQIGAQIFIDAWAMAVPGDPAGAAALARRAAAVSHDGEAVHAAACLAAMESQAFVEHDMDRLLDAGLSVIPAESTIARMIRDLRRWRTEEPDWRKARERLAATYGYDSYGGNVHVVPNHGLIVLSLLWGDGDFGKTMLIVNTSGWDTDCNSGNAGCLMGIRGGLPGFEGGTDWRGPVADRLYLPTSDGGRSITDAVIEADRIAAAGRYLAGDEPIAPKGGARFHFGHPGAIQGFAAASSAAGVPPVVRNKADAVTGDRSLHVGYDHGTDGWTRLTTPTFVPPDAIAMPGYQLLASPTLYPGQTVRASIREGEGPGGPVAARLVIAHYDGTDQLCRLGGPETTLAPGAATELTWTMPDTRGQPIEEIGVEITGGGAGSFELDWLTWDGSPTAWLGQPSDGGKLWRRAWVDGVDQWGDRWPEPYRLSKNEGTGLISQGTEQWTDYQVDADVTPWMAKSVGVAARVHGMRRYYALLLAQGGRAQIVRVDGETTVLADVPAPWVYFGTYQLGLEVIGRGIRAWIDGQLIAEVEDTSAGFLRSGGVGLVIEEGTTATTEVKVESRTADAHSTIESMANLEEART